MLHTHRTGDCDNVCGVGDVQRPCRLRKRFLACRLKDPLPYMAKYPDADILTSSDHLVRHHVLPA